MERTKGYLLFNDSRKAPQNQGFSEVSFQKGHSFSSQPRYDRFDTSPDLWLHTVPAFLPLPAKFALVCPSPTCLVYHIPFAFATPFLQKQTRSEKKFPLRAFLSQLWPYTPISHYDDMLTLL